MRKYYLDNIRWLTVMLVVIYHVIYMYNGIITDGVIGPFYEKQYWDGIQYILYPWFMILLFIVAGMCSHYYLETHTIREFVCARTEKLLVPSTVGLLSIGWVQGYINMEISGAFSAIPETLPKLALYFIMALSGTGVLWFIQMLWLFSMILAMLLSLARKVEKEKTCRTGQRIPSEVPESGFLSRTVLSWIYAHRGTDILTLILLAIPVYWSGLILNAPVIVVYRFGIYGFTYFLGYFVFSREETVICISRYRNSLLAGAALLAGVYLFLHYGDNYAAAPAMNCFSAIAYAWIACLAAIGCMKKWGDAMTGFTSFMAKRSFGLYVFHYLPLSATAYGLRKFTGLSALPCYLLTAFAAFAGGLIMYETISRIPLLRWCVLGIKKHPNPR